MPVSSDINSQLVTALRARDEMRLMVLRGLKAAFTNELITLKKSTNDALGDEEALAVIRRLAKQRRDSIEQFRKGGRSDLVDKETAELKVLASFLPAQMSEEEILKLVRAKKETLAVTDKTKLGTLIGAVMKETRGRADGGAVKKIVESLFL